METAVTGCYIQETRNGLTEYLAEVSQWLKDMHLELYHQERGQVNHPLNIFINDTLVLINKNPKILVMIFDPLLTFAQQAKYIKQKLEATNNLLKMLTGSTWDKDKETLTLRFTHFRSCQ